MATVVLPSFTNCLSLTFHVAFSSRCPYLEGHVKIVKYYILRYIKVKQLIVQILLMTEACWGYVQTSLSIYISSTDVRLSDSALCSTCSPFLGEIFLSNHQELILCNTSHLVTLFFSFTYWLYFCLRIYLTFKFSLLACEIAYPLLTSFTKRMPHDAFISQDVNINRNFRAPTECS